LGFIKRFNKFILKKKYYNIKTEEEIKKEKRRKYFNEYMKSCDWYCSVCNNGKNYTLRGKGMHLKTKKHSRNKTKESTQQPLIVF